MYDLILRRARLPDETLIDIAIRDGKIAATGEISGHATVEKTLAEGCYLSAGWIDSHVHCYEKSPSTTIIPIGLAWKAASPAWWMQAVLARMTLTISGSAPER